jgi:hypothetical protein
MLMVDRMAMMEITANSSNKLKPPCDGAAERRFILILLDMILQMSTFVFIEYAHDDNFG